MIDQFAPTPYGNRGSHGAPLGEHPTEDDGRPPQTVGEVCAEVLAEIMERQEARQ